jgi:hypothetical protein
MPSRSTKVVGMSPAMQPGRRDRQIDMARYRTGLTEAPQKRGSRKSRTILTHTCPALRNENLPFDTLFWLTIDIRQYPHVCFASTGHLGIHPI